MDFFRNPEIRRLFFLYAAFTLLVSTAGFFRSAADGILLLSVCCFYDIAAFVTTYRRYRRLASFSHEIDNILHGGEIFHLSDYSEGELSILQNEISKLTVRFREQAVILAADKAYLADSIADISHQVRTPLTSIHLILSFLSEPDLPAERRIELTRELSRLLSRIDWLISALLKMSRLDAGTVRFQNGIVPVADLVNRAAAPLAVPMELRNQQLTVTMQGGETFAGDLAWSTEAIGNVLKNCMEHTPSGGMLYVTASENAVFTEITIRDTGCGIDKSDLPHLFERFYKGKNASDQSVGIGLSLSRMILAKQNGTIRAENAKNGGALFTIRFYKSTV